MSIQRLVPVAGGHQKNRLKRARLGPLEALHQRIWQGLRELAPVTGSGLARALGANDHEVRFYLSVLERAGYLWRQPHTRPGLWHPVHDTGALAPQRLRGGQAIHDGNTGQVYQVPEFIRPWPGQPAAAGTPEHKMWQAMRILRIFTPGELEAVTGVAPELIRDQLDVLHRAGYLGEAAASMGEASWRLLPHQAGGDRPPAISRALGLVYNYQTKKLSRIETRPGEHHEEQ